MSFAASYASGIQVVVYLSLLQEGPDTANKNSLFAATLSLLIIFGAIVLVYRVHRFTRAGRSKMFENFESCLRKIRRQQPQAEDPAHTPQDSSTKEAVELSVTPITPSEPARVSAEKRRSSKRSRSKAQADEPTEQPQLDHEAVATDTDGPADTRE